MPGNEKAGELSRSPAFGDINVSRLDRLPDCGVDLTTGTIKCLGGQYHVVEIPERHSNALPMLQVIANGDRAVLSDRCTAPGIQVLLESRGAYNGRLINLLVLPCLVRMPVAANAAFVRRIAREQVPELSNVELDERVRHPSIDGYVVESMGEANVVAYTPVSTRIPAFAADHITDAGPLQVIITGAIREGHGRRPAAGKQRIEEAAIRARAVVIYRLSIGDRRCTTRYNSREQHFSNC